MNLLEEEAAKLRRQYPSDYHARINQNLAAVLAQMEPAGSVAVEEGIIALRQGLPSLPLKPRKRYRSGKATGKR